MNRKLDRILYVEDEIILQKVTRATLEKMGGLTVEIAKSGAEALEKAPIFKPDLILLDVMMPGMDGPTTLKRLRDQADSRRIPVVFVTAKAQSEEVERFRALGVAGVITKPFDPRSLVERLEAIWHALPEFEER